MLQGQNYVHKSIELTQQETELAHLLSKEIPDRKITLIS